MIDHKSIADDLRARVGCLPEDPKLWLRSPSLVALGRLLNDEVEFQTSHDVLYGDSLVMAIGIELFRLMARNANPHREKLLKPKQLSSVIDFMRENLSGGVGLRTLADLAGMSQSPACT